MIEVIIIAALVIWSALYTFKNVFPKSSARVFTALAQFAEQRGFQKLAVKLRPVAAAGCGGGCGCGPSASTKKSESSASSDVVKAVKWK